MPSVPRLPARPSPGLALGCLVALHSAVFATLCVDHHRRFGSLGFDTGIYDQGIWLLSRGVDPFITLRGMDHWGHHVALVDLLFAVPYRFGAGVELLTAVHTTWLALGAVPLWLLARDRWGSPWAALVAPAAYLLHPATQWLTWWLYHPDSMAVTPLLAAWWLATRRRWGWFAVAVVAAMACKEDVALAVLLLGVALAVRRERRAGALTALAGLAWFAVTTQVVIPLRNDGAPPFYESYFPTLGTSLGEIARGLVLDPSRWWSLATRPKNVVYLLRVAAPYGFVLPFLGPVALLVALPQLAVNLLVEVQDGATLRSQYVALPLVGASLAMVEGVGWLSRRRPEVRRIAIAAVALCALSSTVTSGIGPLSVHGPADPDGPWARRRADHAEVRAALDLVPEGAGVSVAWDLAAQLTHRRIAYEFPNPWTSSNYGPTGNDLGDPTEVTWVVIDRVALGSLDLALYDALIGPGGGFEEVRAGSSVRVARRTGPSTELVLPSAAGSRPPTLDQP